MDLIDEDDPTFERYDCNDETQEPLPKSVIFEPQYEQLQAVCQTIEAPLHKFLHSSSNQCPALNDLREEFEDVQTEDATRDIKISVTGDMASGKSSLINSLLGIGTIARKGDSGQSCSFTVQSFGERFSDQQTQFAAEVHFLDRAQINELLASLLEKYYGAASRPDEGEHTDTDLTDDDKSDMKEVITVMRTLFCDRPEFATDDQARQHLDTATSAFDDSILGPLIDHAETLVRTHQEAGNVLYFEAECCDDLVATLQPYTYRSTTNAQENIPDLWPLVSKVDFGLDTALVSHGLVLVDAPGLTDANRSRRQRALQISRESHYTMLVARIARAESDTYLRAQLRAAFRSHGTSKIVLVLTHADSVDDKTELACTQSEQRDLEANAARRVAISNKIKDAKRLRRNAVKREDIIDVADLTERIEAETKTYNSLLTDWRCMRLAVRNNQVLLGLQELYRDLTGDSTRLMVYTVGNALYQQYQTGFTASTAPSFSIEATGIPQLRAKLLSLPAWNMLDVTLTKAKTQLPKQLDALELYSIAPYVSVDTSIVQLLAHKDIIPMNVAEFGYAVKDAFMDLILRPMKAAEGQWIASAIEISRTWAKVHPTQEHLHVLRHDGYKRWKYRLNPGRPLLADWNGDLMKLSQQVVDDGFASLNLAVESKLESIAEEMQSPIKAMIEQIQGLEHVSPQARNLLLKLLGRDTDGLTKQIGNIIERTWQVRGREIHNRATMFLDDAYLVEALRPTIQSVRQLLYGRNCYKRVELLESKLSTPDIWAAMQSGMELDLQALTDDTEKETAALFHNCFERIISRFRMMVDARPAQTEDMKNELALVDQLRKDIDAARKELDGPVQDLVRYCEEFHAKHGTT